MNVRWLFDVDGTLTSPRERMDNKFRGWFYKFIKDNSVCLVTGSDYNKTIEQVGKGICEAVDAVYCCSGNDKWIGGVPVRRFDWTLPDIASIYLKLVLMDSEYPIRTGNHIEQRQGSINFSIVGRNATGKARKHYFDYDNSSKERERIVKEFENKFPDLEAAIGGETGIDIYPVGRDKSQIINDFFTEDHTVFFGDKMNIGGNDYTLSRQADSAITVTGWEDTWEKIYLFKDIAGEMYEC